MIALAGSAFAWLMGTKAGRVMALIVGGVLAVITFGWTMRRRGRAEETARVKAADDAAVTRATDADTKFRADGGAKDAMRRGDF